ncbi:peptidoglycan D,D-transpeptidase FtsI family protein [Peribacillus huizhouensis]|uniref:serine-type D-Ala-D-Ala carboxypeptidase n=1 Tax=Peribacillus huizhouensis TaxID=1501239 RepID=A0ABR6CNE2_9BACI|nr:penicillin-binding protein 2 [Peribacillus huizhouensis]MBA9026524.1 cell division protein FtsI/penicillin-binding protein 2 [Peribacillus huizhouensis]
MKREKKKKTHIPFRLNMLFLIVFLLFSLLILRLGLLQIVFGEDYKREIERTEDVIVNNPVPRGKMYDRNIKVIVDNEPLNAITYTRSQTTRAREMLETAEKLAQFITKEPDKIRERDRKDFWILKNPEEAEAKITNADRKKVTEGELEEKDLYKLQIERITDEEINSFTKDELEVLAIYREFSSGYALTPQIVKNRNVTEHEFATVSEHLDELPGVGITTDWDRTYSYGNTLKSVLGVVSSSEEGLPSEKLDYYLSLGYSRNDRVGKSYIEAQYENVLQGKKAKMKNVTDKAGNVVLSEVVSEGQRGNDLVLTLDMDLQLAIEEEIERKLIQSKALGNTKFLDRAFVVLIDPRTGEILTMAGKQYTRNKETRKHSITDFALGNITTSYTVGSSVKGATVLTGYQTKAIQPGQIINDTTMRIKNTPPKGSYTNMGPINDLTALKRSSNVYMFKTAIAIGKGNYVPNQPLNLKNPNAFLTIRNSFANFGLGVRTGIDLPNEMVGFKGVETNPGKLMDLAIGQYDTYTPMQLAQYVSTIANGGYRMKPHLVKEIRNSENSNDELGVILEEIRPTVLNKLDMKDSWINRIHEGFEKVAMEPGGTAYKYFAKKKLPYTVAAKTGTAEAFYDGPTKDKYNGLQKTTNLSIVGYAPAANPEVAFAVVVPWANQGKPELTLNKDLAVFAMDTYFELKQKRQEEGGTSSTVELKVDNSDDVIQKQAKVRLSQDND